MDTKPGDLDGARDRSSRFGALPARIHPDDLVETVETETPQRRPDSAGSEAQRQVFLAGG